MIANRVVLLLNDFDRWLVHRSTTWGEASSFLYTAVAHWAHWLTVSLGDPGELCWLTGLTDPRVILGSRSRAVLSNRGFLRQPHARSACWVGL